MEKRKKTVTLIEVLIALGLTVFVLSAITWCYRAVSELGFKADYERREAFSLSYLQARLANSLALAEKKPFYKSHNGLVFQFDNGSDLDKDFANQVIGRLYLDDKHNFVLALMPAKERWKNLSPPIKQQTLLENVDELSFRFFTKNGGWSDSVKELPAIVEVNLKIKGQPINYRFPLPYSDEEIVL